MKLSRYISTALLVLAQAIFCVSCEDERAIPDAKPGTGTGGGGGSTEVVVSTEPAPAPNKVVAHRGGSTECGQPDNSRASLKYAQFLKCYASECDIYWTKDNNIVIAHADGSCKINGLHPWEATLDEIRKAGVLKNGETIPTLEDFLDIVMVEGRCTKLWLDIKNITSPSTLTDYPIKAVQRACEIIKSRKAEKWCEFICTGNTTVGRAAAACMAAYNIPVGWMANLDPASHKGYGYSWANLSTTYMNPYGTGSRTITEFVNAGMEFSVFNVDKAKGDGNAVYSEEAVNYYVSQYPKLKAICTNYPQWLISKIK